MSSLPLILLPHAQTPNWLLLLLLLLPLPLQLKPCLLSLSVLHFCRLLLQFSSCIYSLFPSSANVPEQGMFMCVPFFSLFLIFSFDPPSWNASLPLLFSFSSFLLSLISHSPVCFEFFSFFSPYLLLLQPPGHCSLPREYACLCFFKSITFLW